MLLLYNDQHVPVRGCISDLKLGTDFIFGKIKTVEKTRDNNAIKCLESREITLSGLGTVVKCAVSISFAVSI